MRTHEVLNQAPALQDYDPFAADAALAEALRREGDRKRSCRERV